MMKESLKVIAVALFVFVSLMTPCVAHQLARHIAPETDPEMQAQAAQKLIERVVGRRAADKFLVRVDRSAVQFRSFRLTQNSAGKIEITAWDGVSAAKAFHHYVKEALGRQVSWFKHEIALPDDGRRWPNLTLASTSASPIVYYQNVCTWSYSFAWWRWAEWRRHVDWMAMMGISLTLAPVQELLWRRVYANLSLSETEIAAHFSGPAFLAWQRMGNIRGWAGPLPPAYERAQFELQKRVIAAQRALGMSVALPAFAGVVPSAMAGHYPSANFTLLQRWNKFGDAYCCALFLEPSQPLFTIVARKFQSAVVEAYGTNHVYFADPFNEMQPPRADADYLRATAGRIYGAMRDVDEHAVWLLQGWMFVKNPYWSDELIAAFLTAVPKGRMLVLDLQSEQLPQYKRTHSFHGQPFVWCMLHNFGGTLGLFGSASAVNAGIHKARQMPNSTMVGVGITPEGINQNYAIYALALERAWAANSFRLSTWFERYATARYEVDDSNLRAAWRLLLKSVYDYRGTRRNHGKYAITTRPSFNLVPWTWYNASDVQRAWQLLLSVNRNAVGNYEAYAYDLVDVTRQYLQLTADRLYINLKAAFESRNLARFRYLSRKLMTLFSDLESILASNEHFLLGPWLESAKRLSPAASELFEFNARNQITLWGPTGEIVDYANKQWAGLVRDYYHPRWALFVHETTRCLHQHSHFNQSHFNELVFQQIEQPFGVATNSYPTSARGDRVAISAQIYHKWSDIEEDTSFITFNHMTVPVNVK